MSGHLFARCKAITHELKDRPLNVYFLKPVDPEKEGLPGYFDVITKPMDLSTVQAKLNNDQYTSPLDWYHDVILVYDNALTYHKPDTIWHKIALYNLQEFKKLALGIGCNDPQTWYDMVNNTMFKLSTAMADGPVPQGIDPLILSVLRKAEEMVPPSSQSIAEMVDRINKRIDHEDVKYDILCILKETQPDLKIDGEKMAIDADNLSVDSLKALSLYIKSKL